MIYSTTSSASPSPSALVREWYERIPKPIRELPTLDVPNDEIELIESLLVEELGELSDALKDRSVTRTADALADIVYVAYGAALQFGVDLDAVLAAVHAANMSKANPDGSFELEAAGKVRRGESYSPPDIDAVLDVQEAGSTPDASGS